MLYTLFSLRILGTMQAGQLSPLMAFDTSKVKTNKSKVCVQISYLNVCTKIFVYPKILFQWWRIYSSFNLVTVLFNPSYAFPWDCYNIFLVVTLNLPMDLISILLGFRSILNSRSVFLLFQLFISELQIVMALSQQISVQAKNCLHCQKWSPNKVRGVFSKCFFFKGILKIIFRITE